MAPHLRLTRSGGLAGIDMVADVDVDDLPADAAARVRAALGQLEAAPAPQGGPGGPDRYQYDLEVTDGPPGGGRRTVTAHEPDLSPGLATVVDVLQSFLRPE